MTSRFDWEANGLNRARFEALTKLLRLRYHGQVAASFRFDEPQHDCRTGDDAELDDAELDDDESGKAVTLTDFNPDHLRRVFLDRLAELVANEKGGLHVAATLMVNSQDTVNVFVAKNNKFRPRDVGFLGQIEALLRSIANGMADQGVCLVSKEDSGEHSSRLWKLLLDHYETRIQGYIVDIRQRLKQLFPDEDHQVRAQAPEPSLLSHLYELLEATFAQYSSTAVRNETLVLQSHLLYKNFPVEEFAGLSFSPWQQLRSALGFLGGLQSSFHVLLRAAERLPRFENITISIIKMPIQDNTVGQRGDLKTGKWTLSQVFEHLGRSLTDDQVRDVLDSPGKKSRWTKNKLLREFDKLKSSSWEVHAEMQLLPTYIQAMATNDLTVQYIGCSRNSCFLCWHFLDLFASIRTRGCHGKLYQLWGLPDFNTKNGTQMEQVKASVRDLEHLIKGRILNREVRILKYAKESTVGASSASTAMPASGRPAMVKILVYDYLENQRASILRRKFGEEEPQNEELSEGTVIDKRDENAVPIAGLCGDFDCFKSTSRRCSHCGGAWFCSIRCEELGSRQHRFSCNRGSITTAELLENDISDDRLPEDPQVREDYGFTRCKNRNEEPKLFGLYIGLILYRGITSKELHQWKTEGVLVEKIIEVFSGIPPDSCGGYYPWFLENKHVLDGNEQVIRDEDDVHKYIEKLHAGARAYLDPTDQTRPVEDLKPFAKQYCFHFLAMLLDSMHPPPQMAHHLDLWYDFGFAVCSDEFEESRLANHYLWLLLGNKAANDHFRNLRMDHLHLPDCPTCSFVDFWKAWETGSLMEQFDRYGTVGTSLRGSDNSGTELDRAFPALREFLSAPGKSPRLSVWRLKHFLAIDGANVLTIKPEIAAAAIEYGFYPQLDTRTRLDLLEFYKRIFRRGVLPRDVDKVKRKRKLHEMAEQWYGGDVDDRVKRVLSSVPYTLVVPEVGHKR